MQLHVTFAPWVRPVFRAWRFVSWPLPEKWRRRVAVKIITNGARFSWR